MPAEPTTPTILGSGAALPERVVTNADLVARLDTSDEWIVRRTGIRERRIIDPRRPLADARRAGVRRRPRRRRRRRRRRSTT